MGARVPEGAASDLALDATLRAAAPQQQSRRRSAGSNGAALLVEPWDVREKVRETHTGALILFVVDASGSMGAQRRMVAVKGAVMSLLLDAYQRRDRVGLIAFRGAGAELLLPPTSSVEMAQWRLQELPTGGRTPLSRGLYLALETLETERRKDRDALPLLVLLSDGRANLTLAGIRSAAADEAHSLAQMVAEAKIPAVVVDTEQDYIRLELARPIADAMSARYIKLDDLAAASLADAVRAELG